MKSTTNADLSCIRLRTIALMNHLRISVGASCPYQLSVMIDEKANKLGWPDMTESKRLYKYFQGNVRRHPTQILNLLSQIFQDVENTYWKGPNDLWVALWGDIPLLSTIIKSSSQTLEQSTTEEALNKVFMDYLVDGTFSLPSTIAVYRYLVITDPYGRFGDGHGFGRAFSIYSQLKKILQTDDTNKHLSELGVYLEVQMEIDKIERERINNRPYWVSPIECGRV